MTLEANTKTLEVYKVAVRKNGRRFTQAGLGTSRLSQTDVENALEVLIDMGYVEEVGEMGSGTYKVT